jgi:tetratricopeptide (TPR) repeat protein
MDIRFAAVCVAVNQFDDARPLLETSLAVARQMGLPTEVALIHTIMGRIAWIEGDSRKSVLYDRQALDAYRQLQKTADIALCLDRLGTSAWSIGDYVSARQFLQESLGLLKPDGAPGYLARILDHLGVVARDSGNLESALTYFQESRENLDGLDAPGQLVFVTNHLAGIMLMTGHAVEAAAQFEYCIALSREIGHRRALAYNLHDLGGIQLNIFHNPEKAGALFDESYTIFEAIGERFGKVLTCNDQAGAAFDAGQKDNGLEKLKHALNESLEIQNTRLIVETLIVYANFLNHQGRFTEAAELLGFLATDLAAEASASIRENNLVENVGSALPAETMEAALARGHALGLDEIRSRLERE